MGLWDFAKYLGTFIVGCSTASAGLYPIYKDLFFPLGQQQERANTTASLQALSANMPAEQRPVIQALVDILAANNRNAEQLASTGTSIESQARQLTTIIKSIGTERYTPSDNLPVIEISLGTTALICKGKYTINYKGRTGGRSDVFLVLLDGVPWTFYAGSRYDKSGLKLTIMEAGPAAVRILTSCG